MVAYIKTWKPGEYGHPEPVFKDAEIERIKPGESMSTTFTCDKAGSFVYACVVENPDLHAKLGMWAPFVVEGPSGVIGTESFVLGHAAESPSSLSVSNSVSAFIASMPSSRVLAFT